MTTTVQTQALPTIEQGAALVELLSSGNTLSGLLGRSEKSQEALYHVAYVFYGQAKYTEAMRMFAFLLANNHLDRRFYMGFAGCMQMLDRHEEALKYYGIASLLDLTDPLPPMHMAECHIAMGQRDKARESLEYGLCQGRAADTHVESVRRMEGLLALLDGSSNPADSPAH
ncbi:MAG: SycD/LcrH family type III secretion system chaperone [Pseudomonadota bacterium]